MKKASQCTSMMEIRDCIDALDKEIISLIGQRFDFVKEIVKYKTDEVSIIAKPRYENVIQTRRELATHHGLNADMIEKMYRIMMDSFIEEELKILKNK